MTYTFQMIAAAVAALAVPTIAGAAPAADERAITALDTTGVASQRYCVVTTPTGSLIARRTCKSLEGWLAQGVDPRARR